MEFAFSNHLEEQQRHKDKADTGQNLQGQRKFTIRSWHFCAFVIGWFAFATKVPGISKISDVTAIDAIIVASSKVCFSRPALHVLVKIDPIWIIGAIAGWR